MQIDARQLPDTSITDFCVVGAGPAGLTVASVLNARGKQVMVLESGTDRHDEQAQELNRGDVIGDPYAGLMATRFRGLGGTTLIWNTQVAGKIGAKFVPLDPIDFRARWPEAPGGWPFDRNALEPWYVRAHELCGLGAFDYSDRLLHTPSPFSSSQHFETRAYRFASADVLLGNAMQALRESGASQLVLAATVVQLSVQHEGVSVTLADIEGRRRVVHAQRVVLACGAVENSRILLHAQSNGVRDQSGWLGCGFMEHPRDRTLSIRPAADAGYRALAAFDAAESPDGVMVAGRLALRESAIQQHDLINASVTFLPEISPRRDLMRRYVERIGMHGLTARWLPRHGHGWATRPAPSHVFAGLRLLINMEQPPHRDNRIVLGRTTDRFGVPRAVLHWRWHEEDQQRLVRLRELVVAALQEAAIGPVVVTDGGAPDPNAHHHAGTTRMHPDPRSGVVDDNGLVHGTTSLFVTGASVFPAAGFANPLLTIVALALRLGDYLAPA